MMCRLLCVQCDRQTMCENMRGRGDHHPKWHAGAGKCLGVAQGPRALGIRRGQV